MVFDTIQNEISPRYREAFEEALVDEVNVIAQFISRGGSIDTSVIKDVFTSLSKVKLDANIYDLKKSNVDLRVYVTDDIGKVLYHSYDKSQVGADYSQWRDVFLTLKGQYGARSTRDNIRKESSSVLYVAAPIVIGGDIQGVVTVGKPTMNVNKFIEATENKFVKFFVIFGIAVSIGVFIFSIWVTAPLQKMLKYTRDVASGKNEVKPPSKIILAKELREVGDTVFSLNEELKAKRYIEEYIQVLTHEIKSPLTSIKGAAELLNEDMEREHRTKFLDNISSETNRIQGIIDSLLELARIDKLDEIQEIEWINVRGLTEDVLKEYEVSLGHKGIQVINELPEELLIRGDKSLVHKVLSNVLSNALEFSFQKNRIWISGSINQEDVVIEVRDEGAGVPEYALEKVFDKFYSLPRPDSQKKSSGIGLAFCRKVMDLHRGEIQVRNTQDKPGVIVQISFLKENFTKNS